MQSLKEKVINLFWFFPVQQHCHRQYWWNDAFTVVTSVESYEQMVRTLFEDEIVNQGRLLVLEVFTRDLCDRCPDIASEVWDHYKKTRDELCPHSASAP